MASTGERQAARYRPELDGLRGLAVLMVLVGHTFPKIGLSLGDTGVALFFALSGYLITGLLLDEHDRTTGHVQLVGFYVRRAARLLPALLLMVVVMDVLFVAVGYAETAWFSLPALLYATNYVAVMAGQHLPAFGHTWSLAVEEHFYLAWPPLLIVLLRRFSPRRVMAVTLGLCAAALVWRLLLASLGASDLWLYLGSLERADALLYGCAAAMAAQLGWNPPRWAFVLAAAVVVAHVATPTVASPVFTSAALGLAGAVLVAGLADWARRGFSYPPLVAVGVRSYGIYLWHMPLLTLGWMLGFGYEQSVLMAALGVAAAWASCRWVEQPIRDAVRDRLRRRVVDSPRDLGDRVRVVDALEEHDSLPADRDDARVGDLVYLEGLTAGHDGSARPQLPVDEVV